MSSSTVRSFDIFDTLLARRCIEPQGIFAEVERRLALPGFAARRVQAERAVEATEYQLADIYRWLAGPGGLGDETAQRAMSAEIESELDNALPVQANLDQLEADSLLITDMYLPEPVIRALLRRIGVPAHLALLRSANGKRSGRVWQTLRDAGLHCQHLGDHPISDVQQPLAHGMQAQLTRISEPSTAERALIQADCPGLARALRVARLSTPRGALDPRLQRLQAELNLPMLAIAALCLHARLVAGDVDTLVFSSRDTRYLHEVFLACGEALRFDAAALPASYWWTSRRARTEADDAYRAYCRAHLTGRPLVVDLCGTGASITVLRAVLDLPEGGLPMFVCQRLESGPLNESLKQRYGIAQIDAPQALWTDANFVPNEVLELLNYVPEGMVLGVREALGGWVPLRAPIEFDAPTLAQVRAQAEYVGAYCKRLREEISPAVQHEVVRNLAPLRNGFAASAGALAGEINTLLAAWLPAHRRQEQNWAARAQ